MIESESSFENMCFPERQLVKHSTTAILPHNKPNPKWKYTLAYKTFQSICHFCEVQLLQHGSLPQEFVYSLSSCALLFKCIKATTLYLSILA